MPDPVAPAGSAEPVELVRYEVRDRVATITLDSPRNRNALSTRLVTQLLERLHRADDDPDVRVVVLAHTGGTFCAGADLTEAVSAADGDPVSARAAQLAQALRTLITLGTPVLVRVDGHVRAGGMGLVGAADLVVAGPAATFALTESRLGLAPSVVSLVVVPRLGGRDASRYVLTGDTFDAATAARIGFVTEAAGTPEQSAEAVARLTASILAASPQGLRESKRLLNHDLVASFDAGLDRVVDQSSRLFASEEAGEGMLAFLQKRPPRWAGPGSRPS